MASLEYLIKVICEPHKTSFSIPLTRTVMPAKMVYSSVCLVTDIADVRAGLLGLIEACGKLTILVCRYVRSQTVRHR
jgi:hypothetical protein